MPRSPLAAFAALSILAIVSGCAGSAPPAASPEPATLAFNPADAQVAAAPRAMSFREASARMQRETRTYTGRVIEVADGDTLKLRTGNQTIDIRFSDIDTPETAHGASRPGQPGGQAAGQSLAQMALNRQARAVCYPGETYGRKVCHVYVGDVNLNLEQVRRGWAWANRQNPSYMRFPEETTAAEAQARAARRGIWQQPNPIPPWVWRDRCWEDRNCVGAGA